MDYQGLVLMIVKLIILELLPIIIKKMLIDNHRLRNNTNGFLVVEELHIWEGLIILAIILDLVLINLILTINSLILTSRRNKFNDMYHLFL